MAKQTPRLMFERRRDGVVGGFATKGGGGQRRPPSRSSEQGRRWTMNGGWRWVTKGGSGQKRPPAFDLPCVREKGEVVVGKRDLPRGLARKGGGGQ